MTFVVIAVGVAVHIGAERYACVKVTVTVPAAKVAAPAESVLAGFTPPALAWGARTAIGFPCPVPTGTTSKDGPGPPPAGVKVIYRD